MVATVVGGFIAFFVIVVLIIAFSVIFTKYFQDKHDTEWLPTVVTITGLIFVLCCLALVPVDIFVVSSTLDSKTGERQEWAANQTTVDNLVNSITIVYYVLYSIMLAYCFIVIPFAYFFFEEYEDEITFGRRALGALKYTIFTVVIMVVILILGFFLSPGDPNPSDPSWYLGLFNASNGVRAMCFVIACLTILGLCIFITYTAYGLTAMPIGMIKGKAQLTNAEMETLDELQGTREKQRSIQAKYLGGKKISKKDKKELEDLEKKERLLSRRSSVIEYSQNNWLNKCATFFRPFQVIIGVLLLLLTTLIFISILLTSIDKAANSYCTGSKASCGFILENPEIFNPLDYILVNISVVFPLDYILMVGIIAYIFFATLSGIMRIGIRFFWVYMYKVRPKATVPQGLLLTCMLLVFGLLYLNTAILTIAPQYGTFGYQKYCNLTDPENLTPCADHPEEIFPCSLDSPSDKCTQTAFSILVNRITVLTPFFGVVFFIGDWLFMAVLLIGLIFSICRARKPDLHFEDESDEE